MRTVPLSALTGQAWAQAKQLLLQPFRWRVWFKLLLIVWLSGNLSGGCHLGGSGRSGSSTRRSSKRATISAPTAQRAAPSTERLEPTPHDSVPSQTAPQPAQQPVRYEQIRHGIEVAQNWLWTYRLIIAGVLFLVIALILFMDWLCARFNFVFVDAVTSGAVAITEPFRRWRDVARSLFWWMLGFSTALLAIWLVGLYVWGASLLSRYAQAPEIAVSAFLLGHLGELIVGACALIVLIIVGTIVWVWLIDFVVPIMWLRRCQVLDAWAACLELLKRSGGDAVKYLLWRFMLSVVSGLVVGIASLLALLALALIGVVVGLLGFGLAKLVPMLTIPLIVTGAILLAGVIGALIVAGSFAQVFVAVWFRLFSLRYVQAMDAQYRFFPEESKTILV